MKKTHNKIVAPVHTLQHVGAMSMALLVGMIGCTGPQADDSGTLYDCLGSDDPSLTLGQGQGDAFEVIEEGSVVGLDVAPQGGFGVSVRARTTGLVADDLVDVLLVTKLDGELSGSFLNENTQLLCQDDGAGLLWGVVVGFDPDTFASNDDLLALNGQVATLVVTATDSEGDAAVGTVNVQLEVGR